MYIIILIFFFIIIFFLRQCNLLNLNRYKLNKKELFKNNSEKTICMITRFKNERHIFYEFINHYLEEGIDCIILIDDNSNDNYFELNKSWLGPLIKNKQVIIKKSSKKQIKEYDLHLKFIKKFDWVIVCDMDEFFFSVKPNSSLKSILNNKLSKYDCIFVPWKLFNSSDYFQPKSVINNNIYTHHNSIDPSSRSNGYKYIVKTKNIKHLGVHNCKTINNTNILRIKNCFNNLIQNNHYRIQSQEYLRGVKEIRGGGIHRDKYKNYNERHEIFNYNKKCNLLKFKRKNLIDKCLELKQIKPKIYKKSSFYKEIHK